jgi:hypothetical protein
MLAASVLHAFVTLLELLMKLEEIIVHTFTLKEKVGRVKQHKINFQFMQQA